MRRLLLILLAVFVLIQFIRPQRNLGEIHTQNHISRVLPASVEVETILQKACYDCHSNQTRYPWYAQLAPASWWLSNHVNEGKRKLNFSEFADMPLKKQAHKMEEVIEMIEQGEMPLKSYTLIHRDAVLTPAEKETLIAWARPLASQAEKRESGGEPRN